MGKLPAFLFYPKDWVTDPQLLMCSRIARSVWIDMICLMFCGPVRGVCASAEGKAWSDREIARAIGGDIHTNEIAIAELLEKGVASRDEHGAIFSRRMVRDETERRQNAARQSAFRGRNAQSNGESNAKITPEVIPKYANATATANATENAVSTQSVPKNQLQPHRRANGFAAAPARTRQEQRFEHNISEIRRAFPEVDTDSRANGAGQAPRAGAGRGKLLEGKAR